MPTALEMIARGSSFKPKVVKRINVLELLIVKSLFKQ